MYQNNFYSYPYNQYQYGSNMSRNIYPGVYKMNHLGYSNGLFSKIANVKSRFDFNSFLNNTQRTLGIINQAIPIVYQIRPIWNNAKTMFRVMGALNEDSDQERTQMKQNKNENENKNYKTANNQPQFFL